MDQKQRGKRLPQSPPRPQSPYKSLHMDDESLTKKKPSKNVTSQTQNTLPSQPAKSNQTKEVAKIPSRPAASRGSNPAPIPGVKSMNVDQTAPIRTGQRQATTGHPSRLMTPLVLAKLSAMYLDDTIAQIINQPRRHDNAAINATRLELLQDPLFDLTYRPQDLRPRQPDNGTNVAGVVARLSLLFGSVRLLVKGEENLTQEQLEEVREVRNMCLDMRYFDRNVQDIYAPKNLASSEVKYMEQDSAQASQAKGKEIAVSQSDPAGSSPSEVGPGKLAQSIPMVHITFSKRKGQPAPPIPTNELERLNQATPSRPGIGKPDTKALRADVRTSLVAARLLTTSVENFIAKKCQLEEPYDEDVIKRCKMAILQDPLFDLTHDILGIDWRDYDRADSMTEIDLYVLLARLMGVIFAREESWLDVIALTGKQLEERKLVRNWCLDLPYFGEHEREKAARFNK